MQRNEVHLGGFVFIYTSIFVAWLPPVLV